MDAPRQAKGAVIKATLLNAYASGIDALDPGINAPRDVSQPAVENEQASGGRKTLNFASRQTVEEVVTNPDDETQTVTVEKDTQVVFNGSDNFTYVLNITY